MPAVMEKLFFIILANEQSQDHQYWEEACREKADQLEWRVVDLTRSDWLEQVTRRRPHGLLARPPAYTTPFKTLYDERVRILHAVCGLPVFPSLEEIEIYENKKYLAYWLAANGIPHPHTGVFYHQEEAMDFVAASSLPLVGKTNIGASGQGVRILRSRKEAEDYVHQIFNGHIGRKTGPRWMKKGFAKRVAKKLMRPAEFREKMKTYRRNRSEKQKDFAILQAFVPHQYEWRCVRIGESFFAHKKLTKNGMASGTLLKGYDNPPLELFDFVKQITDRHGLRSQSVDLFETAEGSYLVNEMQCVFGQSDPYQMLVDGQPGRYRCIEGQWVFEAGDFNRLKSYALRLEYFMKMIASGQLNTIP